ncbi:hypothetical protein GVN24_33460 [Rhizobium sp. CRIBSB]|nr:hypothetical protein [Rhizobium sp. CRIBSB]
MLFTVLFALLSQDPAAGTIAWTRPAEPEPVPAPVADRPVLPQWALDDPFAWERAQCSPLLRKEPTLEACQARVRTDLAAHLGDALPPALQPATLENCRRSDDGFAVTCGEPPRADRPAPVLREQDCRTRLTRQGEGGPGWTSDCRPAPGDEPRGEGLSIRLGGED